MPTITVCLIARDEAPYLIEWIAHYLALGVDRLVIYNNDSSDNTDAILSMINARDPRVEIHYWPDAPGQIAQNSAYAHALARASTAWIGFFDADELLVLKRHDSIQDFLRDAPAAIGAVAINWMLFGSSGERFYRDELQSLRFRRGNANRHVKMISRVNCSLSPWAHGVALVEPFQFANDEWQQIELEGGCRTSSCSFFSAQVNHYVVRSAEEYSYKTKRGYVAAVPGANIPHPRDSTFWRTHDQNHTLDSAIDPWIERAAQLRGELRHIVSPYGGPFEDYVEYGCHSRGEEHHPLV